MKKNFHEVHGPWINDSDFLLLCLWNYYLLVYCIYYDTNYNSCCTYTNTTHTQHTDQLSELSLNKLNWNHESYE